ncbi:MAG: Lrp/AsnC family transcriptional regulator [Halobacteriales archaeon SW_8_66_22]|jgi:DNA-binding Lrp family transcriptional regulator|nr:MAG: Lrp/AsnC family transcriptional regulator [Halobacteriales archaeon QH_6_66_25]PSP90982.1 MAG: Lrp/AsnC family transcriptional regulator [Halobacteriales archaeon QS_4_66_20]PSQ60925.1 MAG: Lrp/AsnC family transcriptional regulator [Halobacteriales archaeon SW_8_66_22]
MSSRDAVLGVLRENARASSEDIARQTDSDPETVEAIIDELEAAGVVRGYQAVIDRDQLESQPVRATVELNVTLDRETGYDDIAERIARFPQVKSLYLVSGDFDFMMEVEDESMQEVSAFISDKVAPVPEITQTVTHYVMDSYKEQGIEMGDGDEDDRLSVSP